MLLLCHTFLFLAAEMLLYPKEKLLGQCCIVNVKQRQCGVHSYSRSTIYIYVGYVTGSTPHWILHSNCTFLLPFASFHVFALSI